MMIDKENAMTRETALLLLATTTMEPFTKADWMSFSGCNTENPLIGETDEWVIILDGNELEILPIDPIDGFDHSHKFSLQFM